MIFTALCHTITLAIIFSAVAVGYDPEGECTINQQLDITVCAKPLYDFGIFGKPKQTNGLGFSWNIFSRGDKSHFNRVCAAMYSFDDCIRNNRAKNDCFSEEPIKSQYVTTFALLEYFCKEKRHDVSKYYGCISTYSNSPFVSLCQRNLKRRISSMSSEKSNDEKHIRAEFCSAFNEFTDCVHINFDRECGNSVAKLMKEGIKRSIRIILPECGSYRKSGSENSILNLRSFCSILFLFLALIF